VPNRSRTEHHPKNGPGRSPREKAWLLRPHFVGSDRAYGTYDPETGRAWQVKAPVTERVLLDHVLGRKPFATYLLERDRTRALAVDFDDLDPRLPLEFVAAAGHYQIPSYIERSKSKGFHVWILFKAEGVMASKARLVAQHILDEIEHPGIEIFPKQDRLSDGTQFGNFINVPLFGKLVPRGRTVFVEPTLAMEPYEDQWAFLDAVESVPEATLDEVIEINGLGGSPGRVRHIGAEGRQEKGASRFGLLPCAKKMLDEGVETHQRVTCYRLAIHLKMMGLPFESAVGALKAWGLKNRPRDGKGMLTETEIAAQTQWAYTKDYRSYGCEDPVIARFCSPECPIFRKRQVRGPERVEGRAGSRRQSVRPEP